MKKLSFIYIVIAGILWGTSGIFFNLLSPLGFTPIQMTAMRGAVSGVVMTLFVLIKDPGIFKVRFSQFVFFALSGLSIFGTATSYYASMEASGVSTAVVLMYTAPVFVMAYSVAFLGERLSMLKLSAVIMMILGCAFVSGIMGGMYFSIRGVLFGLLSGVLYSAYNIFTRISMMKGSKSLSATVYAFITMGTIAFCTCRPAQLIEIASSHLSYAMPLIIAIGVFTCILPYFFYTMALKTIPAGTASALGIIEPLSATIFSVVIFKEILTFWSVLGILLILTAVCLINRDSE